MGRKPLNLTDDEKKRRKAVQVKRSKVKAKAKNTEIYLMKRAEEQRRYRSIHGDPGVERKRKVREAPKLAAQKAAAKKKQAEDGHNWARKALHLPPLRKTRRKKQAPSS